MINFRLSLLFAALLLLRRTRRSTSLRRTIILRGMAFISIPHSRRATRPILVRDLNFNGTIVGNVHAQPLYIEGGPNGPMIIAVTASNNVYALNATTGAAIWPRTDIGRLLLQSTLRNIQSGWYHWHARCRSSVTITFLRCIDRWLSH